jgi:hypothetical protein
VDPGWTEARKVEEWAGETRVNVVRVLALLAFYGQHMLNYAWLGDAGLTPGYHRTVTALVIAWGTLALALHVCLGRRLLPWWLKYAATAWDAAMVTVLVLASGGVDRTLVALYFLVIATAPLRFSLPLVWWATAASLVGYLVLLGHAKWYAPAERLPRHHQVIFGLSLLIAGLLAGQAVRQARRALGAAGRGPA